MARKLYPSDVSDAEWAFVASYLVLMDETAPQRVYSLREVYNGLRHAVRAGEAWRMMPNDPAAVDVDLPADPASDGGRPALRPGPHGSKPV